MIAETPVCMSDECTSWPRTRARKPQLPFWPVTTRISEGSPTMTASGGGIRASIASISGGAPMQPISSSRVSARRIGRRRPAASISGTSASAMAQKPFMSQVPRPCRRPARSARRKGSLVQSWPATGTTSVWPERTTPPATGGPTRARRLAFSPVSSGRRSAGTPCSPR